MVANITLRNAVEEWRLRNDLAKTPRVSSPGEEKRRSLHAALDMREVRLQDMKGEEPSVGKSSFLSYRNAVLLLSMHTCSHACSSKNIFFGDGHHSHGILRATVRLPAPNATQCA